MAAEEMSATGAASERRLRFLRSVEIFAALDADDLAAVAESLEEVTLPEGTVLFRQGDVPDGVYVLETGRLAVFFGADDTTRDLGEILPGECVGETALLLATERTATARAEVPSTLLRLPVDRFRRALDAHEGLRRMVGGLFERRLPGFRAATTDLFGELPDAERLEVGAALSWVRLRRHEVLFHRGDAARGLFVILHGRLQAITERPEGDPEVVSEMARGEVLGEIALLTGEPHSLTVRAARDTDLLRLSPEGFETLVARHPRVLLPIVRTLARRLRVNAPADARAARTQVLAVLPVDRDVPLAGLVPRLLDALGEAGRVLTLDAARFDALLGPGASVTTRDQPRFLRLSEWLSTAEAAHDFVVFIGDPEPTPWTERCLRQADRVLIVARAGTAASLGVQARLLAEMPPARDLVLLHAEGAAPFSDTGRWLDAVPVERHHHVRVGSARDVYRLARILSGRAVGVVLGGGGARGFAHAGVLRALEECGIPVDCVGGVSMGAVAAVAYAMGWGHEGVVSAFRRAFVETLPWKYDLPLVSVFDPRPGDRVLQRIFGDTRIEDLGTSGFCVAANITRARIHVFRRGPVWRAVRASGAFPGLVPPVPENGELLVDGGLLTNLPVDVMQKLSPGPVIACDVSREVELQVDPDLTLSPTSRHMLLRRLRRSGPRFPGIAPILLRAVECREVAEKEARRRAAALYLAPPLAPFGLMDVKKIDAIVEAGYRYALERLRDLPASFPRQPVERSPQ